MLSRCGALAWQGSAAELPPAQLADLKMFLSAYNESAAATAESPPLSERAQKLLETARGACAAVGHACTDQPLHLVGTMIRLARLDCNA